MTTTVDLGDLTSHHRSAASARRARRRHLAETRLKLYGIVAILLAAGALALLISTVVVKTANVVFEYYLDLDVTIEVEPADRMRIDDPNPRVRPDLDPVVREALKSLAGGDVGRSERRELYSLRSGDAGLELGDIVKADPTLIGETLRYSALLDDEVQMYLKGGIGRLRDAGSDGAATIAPAEGAEGVTITADPSAFASAIEALRDARAEDARRARAEAARNDYAVRVTEEALAEATDETRAGIEADLARFTERRDAALARAAELTAKAEDPSSRFTLTSADPSVLVRIDGGWVKAAEVSAGMITGTALDDLDGGASADEGAWTAFVFERPEASRNLSDRQIVWIETFDRAGLIEKRLNTRILQQSDSSNAELAGIWGALVGSFWTMVVTFLLAFPLGVMAAIYLEEFAPKNKVTDFIEVNINNLAAVPSIVFGLLGLAIFVGGIEFQVWGIDIAIGGFVPRSSPLAGGMVLALMTLPTIIIASRASIRAVPPSIRDAALGLGASRLQTATHHVLPLAMPGILTGSIIGMAQALGETAPLLLVGMNSFIQEPPATPLDPGNVLPTLIFQWNNNSERLFDDKTAAAISVLLIFLVAMNALAVLLRKRFERRW